MRLRECARVGGGFRRKKTEEDWTKLCAHLGGARKLIGAPFKAVVPAGWRQMVRGKPVGWWNPPGSTWACSVTTESLKDIRIYKDEESLWSVELLRIDAATRVRGFSLRLIQE